MPGRRNAISAAGRGNGAADSAALQLESTDKLEPLCSEGVDERFHADSSFNRYRAIADIES